MNERTEALNIYNKYYQGFKLPHSTAKSCAIANAKERHLRAIGEFKNYWNFVIAEIEKI